MYNEGWLGHFGLSEEAINQYSERKPISNLPGVQAAFDKEELYRRWVNSKLTVDSVTGKFKWESTTVTEHLWVIAKLRCGLLPDVEFIETAYRTKRGKKRKEENLNVLK